MIEAGDGLIFKKPAEIEKKMLEVPVEIELMELQSTKMEHDYQSNKMSSEQYSQIREKVNKNYDETAAERVKLGLMTQEKVNEEIKERRQREEESKNQVLVQPLKKQKLKMPKAINKYQELTDTKREKLLKRRENYKLKAQKNGYPGACEDTIPYINEVKKYNKDSRGELPVDKIAWNKLKGMDFPIDENIFAPVPYTPESDTTLNVQKIRSSIESLKRAYIKYSKQRGKDGIGVDAETCAKFEALNAIREKMEEALMYVMAEKGVNYLNGEIVPEGMQQIAKERKVNAIRAYREVLANREELELEKYIKVMDESFMPEYIKEHKAGFSDKVLFQSKSLPFIFAYVAVEDDYKKITAQIDANSQNYIKHKDIIDSLYKENMNIMQELSERSIREGAVYLHDRDKYKDHYIYKHLRDEERTFILNKRRNALNAMMEHLLTGKETDIDETHMTLEKEFGYVTKQREETKEKLKEAENKSQAEEEKKQRENRENLSAEDKKFLDDIFYNTRLSGEEHKRLSEIYDIIKGVKPEKSKKTKSEQRLILNEDDYALVLKKGLIKNIKDTGKTAELTNEEIFLFEKLNEESYIPTEDELKSLSAMRSRIIDPQQEKPIVQEKPAEKKLPDDYLEQKIKIINDISDNKVLNKGAMIPADDKFLDEIAEKRKLEYEEFDKLVKLYEKLMQPPVEVKVKKDEVKKAESLKEGEIYRKPHREQIRAFVKSRNVAVSGLEKLTDLELKNEYIRVLGLLVKNINKTDSDFGNMMDNVVMDFLSYPEGVDILAVSTMNKNQIKAAFDKIMMNREIRQIESDKMLQNIKWDNVANEDNIALFKDKGRVTLERKEKIQAQTMPFETKTYDDLKVNKSYGTYDRKVKLSTNHAGNSFEVFCNKKKYYADSTEAGGDGNCLFNSISAQLRQKGLPDPGPVALRQMCGVIQSNALFRPYQWATETETYLLANILGMHIEYWAYNEDKHVKKTPSVTYGRKASKNGTMRVLHINGNHYTPLHDQESYNDKMKNKGAKITEPVCEGNKDLFTKSFLRNAETVLMEDEQLHKEKILSEPSKPLETPQELVKLANEHLETLKKTPAEKHTLKQKIEFDFYTEVVEKKGVFKSYKEILNLFGEHSLSNTMAVFHNQQENFEKMKKKK